MFLGIEIGGTKLQLGVGAGEHAELATLERHDIHAPLGAKGILAQIETSVLQLVEQFEITKIGIGFGGPVDATQGRTITSHQISGWDNFELVAWCRKKFGIPAVIGNDCDLAALAEATLGAGCDSPSLFYVTVGTGIGGGLVVNRRLHGAGRPAVAEIGHLRPGLHADRHDATVESLASGRGIAEAAKARLDGGILLPFDRCRMAERSRDIPQDVSDLRDAGVQDLLQRAGGDLDRLTGKMVGDAATDGNALAIDVIRHATGVLGWAVAQAITLLAPEIVVVGGGVSLLSSDLFLVPLREAVAKYVFPPLDRSYEIVPAALGELVVVHGAIALAQSG